MQADRNHYTPSNQVAVRLSDRKPDVMYQSQSTGITFDNGVRYATGDCPKCGHTNSGIYYPRLKTQDDGTEVTIGEYLKRHGAQVHCCACGIPYAVSVG